MELKVEIINKFLSNLEYPKGSGLVEESTIQTVNSIGSHNDWEGNQDSFNEFEKVYSHPDYPGVLMKVVTRTDSYGNGSEVHTIQFGKSVVKTVSVFEAVN